MKRRIFAAAAALCLAAVLLLPGCSKARPVPAGMDEQTVGEAAREVVTMLRDGDYQGVADKFRLDMREEYGITADTVRDLMSSVSEAGSYERTTKTLVVGGGENENYDDPFASAAVYCDHESKNVIYEFSFDTDMNLIGMQIKLQKKSFFNFGTSFFS